jgi:hypothetical protein
VLEFGIVDGNLGIVKGDQVVETFRGLSLARAERPLLPAPRRGAKAVVTASERALFVVGGRYTPEVIPKGFAPDQRTFQIWRFDLNLRQWSPLLLNDAVIPPQDVLATTYDYRNRRLLVLDQVQVQPVTSIDERPIVPNPEPGQGITTSTVARLIVYDLKTRSSAVLQTWTRRGKGFFEALALTALDDGGVLLTGAESHVTRMFRFDLSTEGGGLKVRWGGSTKLNGALIEVPVHLDDSVGFFLFDNQDQLFERVKAGELRRAGQAPVEL